MNPDFAEIAVNALYLALWLSAPFLAVGLVIGIATGIVQSATRVQESALTFVPKLVGTVLVVITLGSWMGHEVVEYTERLWSSLGSIAL